MQHDRYSSALSAPLACRSTPTDDFTGEYVAIEYAGLPVIPLEYCFAQQQNSTSYQVTERPAALAATTYSHYAQSLTATIATAN